MDAPRHPLAHGHHYGPLEPSAGERRTRWVIAVTVLMMTAEIAAGTLFGSMALLADGWHMGTHAAALGATVFAYRYARVHATDARFTFGTGKVGALGGFASACGLMVVSLMVLAESVLRLTSPVRIHFDEAIGVAVIGLVVNLASAWLLGGEDHGHGHGHGQRGHDAHGGDEDHGHEHGHAHGHGYGHGAAPSSSEHRDHNLRGAYLHVLADALTSVLAIAALLVGRELGWAWMDPVMGVVGALVIARWSLGLLGDTSRVLLDAEVSPSRLSDIRAAIEVDGCAVTDLHVWRVGPAHMGVIVALRATTPLPVADYKERLARFADLVHVTVEIHPDGPAP